MPSFTAHPGETHLSGQPLPALLQGKDCVEDKPAHISQQVWSFCCWRQFKTPTKTAKPFKTLLTFYEANACTSDLLIQIQVFLAAADTHAKAITSP